MTKGEVLRDRTASAIVDSAAILLADRGDAVSMEEIANAAGVSRATLYRYFRSREELLAGMAAASVRELAARISDAELEVAPFEEAIARLARAIIATGSKYMALSLDSATLSEAHPELQTDVIAPIRAVFQRARAGGWLRPDLPPELIMPLFSGLMKGAVEATAQGRGIEEAAAAVTAVFVHGAAEQGQPRRRPRSPA